MLQNNDKIRVENRNNAVVFYRIPEANIIRRFVAYETKEIPMGELRQAVQIPGTRSLIEDDLIIHNQEAVKELLPGVEPEYFYTAKDVDFLLAKGSLDQLKDALDFAPEGVINLIKEEAVKTRLNDMEKREAILSQTGFDVTNAIKINELSAVPTETETKVRRAGLANAANATQEAESATSARRSEPPKFKVSIKND